MLTNLASDNGKVNVSCLGIEVIELILTNESFILCISLSASGVLKGFDPLLNLVLDGTIEYMRGKLQTK